MVFTYNFNDTIDKFDNRSVRHVINNVENRYFMV